MNRFNNLFQLRVLENAQEMELVEDLQRIVWSGNDADIVPGHLFVTAAHNGGLVLGAYQRARIDGSDNPEKATFLSSAENDPAYESTLVGFVFGFPGLYHTPDGPRLKHCSHMLAVHPSFRGFGIGYALKRAQWQMVRHQGIDRITWTYDPLLSQNANLNIALLGAVCNSYLPNAYGEMRDGLNSGLPSDRFQVDWWVNTERVNRRLSKRARVQLDLAHFLAAEIKIINPTQIGPEGLPLPLDANQTGRLVIDIESDSILLLEIPSDFQRLRANNKQLALAWRYHTRALFERLFALGFMATDFIYLPGNFPRSFYVLSYGEQTL